MREMGVSVGIQISTDASAAIGIASRRGCGKVRHIEVSQLWLQSRVNSGDITITKVEGKNNVADALTKYVGGEETCKHIHWCSMRREEGRHMLAPEVEEGIHVGVEEEGFKAENDEVAYIDQLV